MAVTDKVKERIAAFARELAEELGEVDDSNSLCWLDAIETHAVAIGDAVSVELLKRSAQGQEAGDEQATCPQCGKLGRHQGQRERELISRRGRVTITEPEYFCPACRRAFFPDDQGARR
jgi:hypothetical protein